MGEFYGRGGAQVKSIQEGTVTIPNGGGTFATAAITFVDTDNALLIHTGMEGGSNDLRRDMTRVALTNSTTVTAYRGDNSAGDTIAGFMVVEFETGIKNIQDGVIVLTSGNATGDATLSSFDEDNSLLFELGQEADTDDTANDFCRIYVVNSTTIRAERGATGNDPSIGYILVEFY